MSSEFWKEVLSWLKDNNIVIESFNEIGWFLGFFEETEDFFIINHVLLLGKCYIYVRKCLGSLPSLRGFIARIRRVYNIELHIRRIRKYLSRWSTETLIHAFVSSRVDYCNILLYGLPAYQLNKLQRVQNAAARLIFQESKYCHVRPLLYNLHWLPVKF